MTGRASPGKCATRTGPCFRSSRDLDTYTTFDILPPLRFFQPIPKWEPCYSVDFAWFKKYLDTVAIVVVNSPMLARRPPLTSRSKSFPCIRLQPLRALFSHPSLYFQSLAASFCKTPGVGYPGPLSTFRCAFCIPNVFTGPADIQTFRRGVPSVTCVFRSLPSVLRFFLQLALLSRACRLGQVVTARPPLRLPGRRIGWRRCRRIAPASLGGA